MGKMQRAKGARVERELVNYLKLRGWDAHRVPLSGATANYKADVIAERGGRRIKLEVKSRKNSFPLFYALIDASRQLTKDDLIAVAVPGCKHLCINISTSLDAVYDGANTNEIVMSHPLYEKYKRTFNRLPTLEKLLGEAEVLVLKDNNKPWIFIRYV